MIPTFRPSSTEEEGVGPKCVSAVSPCPEDEEDTEEDTAAADEEGDAILTSSSDEPPGSPQVLPAATAGPDCDYPPGSSLNSNKHKKVGKNVKVVINKIKKPFKTDHRLVDCTRAAKGSEAEQ